MTGRPGQVLNGELWLRCPHCGDSQRNEDKAHYSVTPEGLFSCLRCGAGGRLSIRDYLAVAIQSDGFLSATSIQPDDDRWEDLLDELAPGPGTARFSALDRYHINTLGKRFDVFLSRSAHGDIHGLCLVNSETRAKQVLGQKLFGWKGEDLYSTETSPLRIVEGPYDVLSDRDVCVFGLPRVKLLRSLKGHYAILCPDGDVWVDYTKLRVILRCLMDTTGPKYLGAEYLPDGKDPDDVPYHQRKFIPIKQVRNRWRTRRSLLTS